MPTHLKKAPCGRAYAWQVRWVLLWIFWLSLDLKYDAHSWQAPQTFSPPLFPSISYGDIAPVLESIHRSTLGHRCLVLRHNSLPFLLKVCPVLFPFLSTSFSPTFSFLPFPPFFALCHSFLAPLSYLFNYQNSSSSSLLKSLKPLFFVLEDIILSADLAVQVLIVSAFLGIWIPSRKTVCFCLCNIGLKQVGYQHTIIPQAQKILSMVED